MSKKAILDTNHNTQASLARALQELFGSKIQITIDPVAVGDWRAGRRLGQGVPTPPVKIGNFWSTREWSNWFEKHMLPKYSKPATADDVDMLALERRAQIGVLEKKEAQGAIAKRQLARERGDYPLHRAEMRRLCIGLSKIMNGIIDSRLEIHFRFAAKAKLAGCGLGETTVDSVVEMVAVLGKETSDALKAELKGGLLKLS